MNSLESSKITILPNNQNYKKYKFFATSIRDGIVNVGYYTVKGQHEDVKIFVYKINSRRTLNYVLKIIKFKQSEKISPTIYDIKYIYNKKII